MNTVINKSNMWLDGIMGVVTGDALGDPVQFMSKEALLRRGPVTNMENGGPFHTPAGTWTDDSSLTLATLSSIAEVKSIDLMDIMDRFVAWINDGEYTPFGRAFDIGGLCQQAIDSYIRSKDVNTCGRTGERANGNGALMRIMPACLYYYTQLKNGELSEDDVVEGIINVAKLTHNHVRTNMCNVIYFYMVKNILDDKDDRALIELLQEGIDNGLKYFGRDKANYEEMTHLVNLFDLEKFKQTDEADITSSGYVIHTIESAIWSLITTDSLKDALLRAANLAGDADTVCAVAGGLAGLYYGYDAIPQDLLQVIKRREWIESLCQEVAANDVNSCRCS